MLEPSSLRTFRERALNAATKLALAALLAVPTPLMGQRFLEQFSYEGLGVAGVGVSFGAITSDRLTTEPTGALRLDYGFIAPKIRVLFGISYFKGDFDADEIAAFERQLRGVVADPTGDFTVDVGEITWADLAGSVDLQYAFLPEARLRPYAGIGLGIHVRDGDGVAIADTFVEDALDTIHAGVVASLGLEIMLSTRLAFTVDARGELMSELRTAAARGGFMYRIPRGGER